MTLDIESIKAREAAASAGEWVADKSVADDYVVWSVIHEDEYTLVCNVTRKEDAEFIAHARENIPALIAEVERLTDEINHLNKHRVIYQLPDEEKPHLLRQGEFNAMLAQNFRYFETINELRAEVEKLTAKVVELSAIAYPLCSCPECKGGPDAD